MQVLKEGIRSEIVRSAEKMFAEKGFSSTSMEMVARNAGVSKGNLYIYFKNKQELFNAVITCEILEIVSAFIIKRITSLLNPADGNHAHKAAGEELISFLIANRMKVLILLNPENEKITGALRQYIVNESCKAYQQFCAVRYSQIGLAERGLQTTLINILYDNIITKIGQILKINNQPVDHVQLLQNLLCYHYNGMIAITNSLTINQGE
jgi:AcrR family transcriptional regulator